MSDYTQLLVNHLSQEGFCQFTGVPCSLLGGLFQYALQNNSFYNAYNEGDAISFACGSYLCGTNTVVLIQNSGLGNTISPLTSLALLHQIPLLMFISLRGGQDDEPQHQLMGEITLPLLDLLKISYKILEPSPYEALEQLKDAIKMIRDGKPCALIVNHAQFKSPNPSVQQPSSITFSSKQAYIEKLLHYTKNNSLLVSTTGFTSRELIAIQDAPQYFYMVGSMGCAPSLALGMATVSTSYSTQVIVLDGDGALLMRLNNLAFIAQTKPKHYLHILFDNHCYESTGSQPTGSEKINWVNIAKNIGYPEAIQVENILDFEHYLKTWFDNPRLALIIIPIAFNQNNSKSSLPRIHNLVYSLKNRFMDFYKQLL